MRRTALYARVSTGLQEKEQTIQSQLAAIARYADQNQLRYTEALTYTDDGYSGTRLDRPALDELRDHAREGRFDVVVVLCPDRLARRYVYQVLILDELKRIGVEVQFCERPIGESADDQLLLQIQGAIAEYERAKILDRCRRGRVHRARRGEIAPPVPPYGYTYGAKKYGGDGQIRVHEEEAAMVRQVFQWYARDGASFAQVEKQLDRSRWKLRRGRQGWTGGFVKNILHCEWYVGRAYYNRKGYRSPETGESKSRIITDRPRSEWIEVPVPRIIDDALFARAQERVEENRKFAMRRQKEPQAYLLKGLLRCGQCGAPYRGVHQRMKPKAYGRAEYIVYACGHHYSYRADRQLARKSCPNKRVDVAAVDAIVWQTVRDLLLDSDAVASHLDAWRRRSTADPGGDERLALTATRIKEMKRQCARLTDAYQEGALSLRDFHSRKSVLAEKIETVERERAELESLAAQHGVAPLQVQGATAVVERLRTLLPDANFQLRQAILRLVIEKVVIDFKRLEIHLALPVSGYFDLQGNWGASMSS